MRRLDQALCVHMDHVGAGNLFVRNLACTVHNKWTLSCLIVLDCDYAPTGKEFVSGGFDRTIRIFPYNKGHSRLIILNSLIMFNVRD